jgi:hypothetical protein
MTNQSMTTRSILAKRSSQPCHQAMPSLSSGIKIHKNRDASKMEGGGHAGPLRPIHTFASFSLLTRIRDPTGAVSKGKILPTLCDSLPSPKKGLLMTIAPSPTLHSNEPAPTVRARRMRPDVCGSCSEPIFYISSSRRIRRQPLQQLRNWQQIGLTDLLTDMDRVA